MPAKALFENLEAGARPDESLEWVPAHEKGWNKFTNGELLAAAEKSFDFPK